jgi:hypothetical protein
MSLKRFVSWNVRAILGTTCGGRPVMSSLPDNLPPVGEGIVMQLKTGLARAVGPDRPYLAFFDAHVDVVDNQLLNCFLRP